LGLLLLRVLVGFTLVAQGMAYLNDESNPRVATWSAVMLVLVSGFCLLSGFLTPIAGVLVVLGSIGLAISSSALPINDLFDGKLVIINVIVVSLAIALVGPGAFSLDARMFGRREIPIPHPSRPTKIDKAHTDVKNQSTT